MVCVCVRVCVCLCVCVFVCGGGERCPPHWLPNCDEYLAFAGEQIPIYHQLRVQVGPIPIGCVCVGVLCGCGVWVCT